MILKKPSVSIFFSILMLSSLLIISISSVLDSTNLQDGFYIIKFFVCFFYVRNIRNNKQSKRADYETKTGGYYFSIYMVPVDFNKFSSSLGTILAFSLFFLSLLPIPLIPLQQIHTILSSSSSGRKSPNMQRPRDLQK